MNATEILALLQSGTVLCVRDIPDTDEGNEVLTVLMENPKVKALSKKCADGTWRSHFSWGK